MTTLQESSFAVERVENGGGGGCEVEAGETGRVGAEEGRRSSRTTMTTCRPSPSISLWDSEMIVTSQTSKSDKLMFKSSNTSH